MVGTFSRRVFTLVDAHLMLAAAVAALSCISAFPLRASATAYGGTSQSTATAISMHQHYDAAYRYQSLGDVVHADVEHRYFLAEALHHVANGRANIGDYDRAAPLYEEALHLAPPGFNLYVDYARAALEAEDPGKARQLAEKALAMHPNDFDAQASMARLLLAQSYWSLGDHKKAIEQFNAAAAMHADFESLYALANAYLSLGDKDSAAKVFAEMLVKFGDTAVMRLDIGRAYAVTLNYVLAIEQFKDAIAKDPRLPGAHYSLAACYLSNSGETAFSEAEIEFHKELAIQPNDPLSYPQLAHIALSRHQYKEAENYFAKSVKLVSPTQETLLLMADLYAQNNRPTEQEAALRRAIAETTDPSRNHYSIHTAHYQLGRLLMEQGNKAEGKKEIDISQELLRLDTLQDERTQEGKAPIQTVLQKTRITTAAEAEEAKAYEDKVGPLIAASYNNLGVHAAVAGNYSAASAFFGKTAEWNPRLDGIDSNWGHAAYAAHDYMQAVGPLGHLLEAHPDDAATRSALGVSQYMIHDYSGALQTFQPIESALTSTPFLAMIDADSMVKTGNLTQGLSRLQELQRTNAEAPILHRALGEAYARSGDHQHAAEELRTAVRLSPDDRDAAYSLAQALIALGQTAEAESLLVPWTDTATNAVSDASIQDSRFYYQLGRLRLDRGDAKGAIGVLETAVQMSPNNGAFHLALAQAYHRNAQQEEAHREAMLSRALLAWHPPANQQEGATLATTANNPQFNLPTP